LTVAGLVATVAPASAKSRSSTLIGQFDANDDGTVDLAEAKKAAGDLFDKLDATTGVR
jgi:hypothetical protein